jgi:asparagine synthase (glutamine-hydrolysing)
VRRRLLAAHQQAPRHQASPAQLLGLDAKATASWFTDEARQLAARLMPDPGFLRPPSANQAALATVRTMVRLSRSERQLATHFDVSLHNPFLDAAVVDVALSVPAAQRTSPYEAKPLLARALGRDVPAFVWERRTKGDFTSDEYAGVRLNATALTGLFSGSRLAGLGFVDDEAVRDVIRRAAAGLAFDLPAFDALVATEAWFTALDGARTATWWADRHGVRP